MAEPVRIRSPHRRREPSENETSGLCTLERWIELPDGRMELRETPLTPEVFLDPKIGDKMVQGSTHAHVSLFLYELLLRWFRSRPDVLVLHDVKHLLGLHGKAPAPDISVIQGLRNRAPEYNSYDLVREKIPPSLIIEVVSPADARIRRVDEHDKVKLYEQIQVRDYILLCPPRLNRGEKKYRLQGYRLDEAGRYGPIEPDARGRLLAESVGLLFGLTADQEWVLVSDPRTGEPLRTPVEEEEGRKAAEAEVARLREELDRLRGN